MTTAPASTAVSVHDEQHRLTVVEGLAALSLDALSSVAYGPEAILVVLVAAGAAALQFASGPAAPSALDDDLMH